MVNTNKEITQIMVVTGDNLILAMIAFSRLYNITENRKVIKIWEKNLDLKKVALE